MKTSDNIHGGDATDLRSSRADLLLERLLNLDMCLVAAWVYMSVAAPMAGEADFDPSGMLFAGIDGLIVAVVAALFIPAALRIRKRSGRPATLIHLMLVIASSLCLAAWAWMSMP